MKPAVVALLIALSAGCGTPANSGYSLDAGGDDSGNITFATGDAAGARGLHAYIEQGQVAVRRITSSCAGDCATVQAVGTGGYPPYTYAWENGSTNPVRQVCPASDAAYSVKVTDTGESGENPRPPQTAGASVTVDVLACPDGGPGDAASAVLSTDGCVGGFVNPSIDGSPQSTVGGAWDASGWSQCPSMGLYPTYLANQSTSALGQHYPAPSAGQTYAVIQIQGVQSGVANVGFSQQLCAPAAAGTSFRIDAMLLDPSPQGTQVGLAVYGGEAVCDESGTMWSSPPLTKSWTTYCVTLGQATPAITFNVALNDPTATALVLIDNIVPVSSCP